MDTALQAALKRKRRKAPSHVVNPTVEDLDPEDFPDQLQSLARDVMTFLDCLNEFPEFNDEAVNASIQSLECDLKVKQMLLICQSHGLTLWYCSIGHLA